MAVPECERYRNSTMFVGTPPFGYEGTDERTSENTSSWHPPRIPPNEMVYREHTCPHHGPCPDKYVNSPSLGNTSSPEATAPEMKLVDVVPALFSSPKLDPHPIEHGGYFPDFSRFGVYDNKRGLGPRNSIANVLEGR